MRDFPLHSLPQEVTLYILSFLDVTDLNSIAQISPLLRRLASDPVLHRTRILVVNPSRLNHLLFACSPQGIPLRPTIADLSQRGVLQGAGIERRWRAGTYFNSQQMVTVYETSKRLQRDYVSHVVSSCLRRRSADSFTAFCTTRVVPHAISSSICHSISQNLMPIIRQLNWSLQKDKMSRMIRDVSGLANSGAITAWIENKSLSKIEEGERARLALCPGIRKTVQFYEELED